MEAKHIHRIAQFSASDFSPTPAPYVFWLTRGTLDPILTPTVLIHKYEDPLTIGDFVEKYEHETIEEGEQTNKEFLQALLKNFFNKVEERQIVHMTIFLASEPRVLR